jgi:hypothetical protein
VIVYLFAAVYKWDDQWRGEGSAVYRTLTNEQFTTRIGYIVRSQRWLCTWMTHATIYLETLGPVALFLPFHVGFQRMAVIMLFVGFHAGLALCMELDSFPFVGMMMWSVLLPPSFWDRVGPQARLVRMAAASTNWLGRLSTSEWEGCSCCSFVVFYLCWIV